MSSRKRTEKAMDYDAMTNEELSELAKVPVNSTSRKIIIDRLKRDGGVIKVESAAAPKSPATSKRGKKTKDEAESHEEENTSRKRKARGDSTPAHESVAVPSFGAILDPSRPTFPAPARSALAVAPSPSFLAPASTGATSDCVQCGDVAHPHEHCSRRLNTRLRHVEEQLDHVLERQAQIQRALQHLSETFESHRSSVAATTDKHERNFTQLDQAGLQLSKSTQEAFSRLDTELQQLRQHMRPAAGGASVVTYTLPVTMECQRCGQTYTESSNNSKACAYHPGELIVFPRKSSKSNVYGQALHACCHGPSASPCTFSTHIPKQA